MKMRNSVMIGTHTIGDGYPTCVVAELGVNHLGDFDRMKEMIHAAHVGGADLLKFQTYVADSRYDLEKNPKARAFTERVREWEFSREKEAELWAYAQDLGATVFTSPFDEESLDFADQMGSVAYKVAGFEVVNKKLIRAIAKKRKPVVFSRGMASLAELHEAAAICDACDTPYIMLHCISSYPLEKKDSHLRMIHTLREAFNCPVGHSDHTYGTDIPPLAVAAGANMIEKHFTVCQKRRESDNFFSITREELEELISKVRQVDSYLGRGDITNIDTEDYMWDFRRKTE